MNDFKVLILEWYRQNRRNLPWRANKNPYRIWLSEIILQQTRVEQGRSYYEKFTDKYPTIHDLNNASEEEVLHLWQGLGYYSRARNLKFAAQQIVDNFNGRFPTTKKELLQLKGVGDYTASAIASIAFNEPNAVVDGNVYRVISRLYEDDTPIDTNQGKKHFQKLADRLLDENYPGDYNQALMELGALVCKPKSPLCESCPVLELCASGRKQTWSSYPVKSKKVKVKKRVFHYLVSTDGERTVIQKRTEKDIWKNLYEFPKIEDQTIPKAKKEFQSQYKLTAPPKKIETFQHKLTHQHLTIHIYLGQNTELIAPENKSSKVVAIDDIEKHPFPIVIKNFINSSEVFLHT